jgi:hypothetical protein
MPMTEQEIKLWYDNFPKEILKHNKPSQETLGLFKQVQQQINKIEITTAEQGKDISYIKDELSKFIKRADDCYAGKYIEKKVEDLEGNIDKIEGGSQTKMWDMFKFILELLIGLGVAYVAIMK